MKVLAIRGEVWREMKILKAEIELTDECDVPMEKELEVHGESLEKLIQNLLEISFMKKSHDGFPQKIEEVHNIELKEVSEDDR